MPKAPNGLVLLFIFSEISCPINVSVFIAYYFLSVIGSPETIKIASSTSAATYWLAQAL
jgi:hypothetical protein